MDENTAMVVLHLHRQQKKYDLEIPLDITANELIVALNSAYQLGIDFNSGLRPYLKTENPIAFLQGDTLLKDYRLRNGTIINYTL